MRQRYRRHALGAFYLDGGQQAVEDADSQSRGVRAELEEPAHLSQPKDHFSVLR